MSEELKERTKDYGVRITKFYQALPRSTDAQTLGKQLLRSGTSVGAHYREAQFAKSDADFISKIEGALQELEESRYWLQIIVETKIFGESKMGSLIQETKELTAILVTIVKKVKARNR